MLRVAIYMLIKPPQINQQEVTPYHREVHSMQRIPNEMDTKRKLYWRLFRKL